MPCHAAMAPYKLIISRTTSVEDCVRQMQDNGADVALVRSDDGAYMGAVTLSSLLDASLPVEVSVPQGALGGSVQLGSAPGITKRYQKLWALPVEGFIDRHIVTVLPHTPLWEGAARLVSARQNLLVVLDQDTLQPLGVVTLNSLFSELHRLQGGE